MAEIVASIERMISDDESHPAGEGSPSGEAAGQGTFRSDLPDFDALPVPALHVWCGNSKEKIAPGEVPDKFEPTTHASAEGTCNGVAGTILAGTPRPVEGLMREMLCPVLRTWLDDNLPTIVERLVRSEIERVARRDRSATGGRLHGLVV